MIYPGQTVETERDGDRLEIVVVRKEGETIGKFQRRINRALKHKRLTNGKEQADA